MLNTIKSWAKSLANQFSKPQTYGSALEQYIVSNNPQNSADVDRLAREYQERNADTYVWARGF